MIFEKIRELISLQFGIDADSVTLDTAFVDDLNADSLDVVELTMAMEEEFGIPEVPEDDLKNILTVGDLVDYVSRFVQD
jgi:acyl carrier protein